MKSILLIFITLSLFSCAGHKKHHHGHHHRFDDAEKWAKIFEDKKREGWQKPQKIFQAVGIKSDSIIADIGSATGFFPIRLAKIAKKGRIWGIDIEPNMVNFLNRRVQKEKINNVYSILGTFDDPLIPEPVDFIFIVDTYHHISKRLEYFNRLKTSLKKNGKIVVIDFRKGDLPFGPKDKMKLSKSQVNKEMTSAGYRLTDDHDFLQYQYVLVFSK